MKGLLATTLVVALSMNVVSQTDTVILDRYTVLAPRNASQRLNGNIRLDSLVVMQHRTGNLADLLQFSSPVTIRSYGPGQISSASYRGASSSQTVVTWNGIRLTNPMLMQTDLSSIPVSAVGRGEVLTGAAALTHSSGAFGSVVALETNLPMDQSWRVEAEQFGGSFGFQSFRSSTTFPVKKWRVKSTFYRQYADNNFRYADNFSSSKPYQMRSRIDAQSFHQGFLHEASLKKSDRNQYSFLLWSHRLSMQVPYPIHQPQDRYDQRQSDDAFRMIVRNKRIIGKVNASLYSGYQYGFMHYSETRSVTDARHAVHGFQQGVDADGLWGRFRWRGSGRYEFQKAITSAYEGNVERHWYSAYGEMINLSERRLIYGAGSRIEWIPGTKPALLPMVVGGFYPDPEKKWFLRYTLHRNHQVPGLNDLYWNPGGNPGLLTEVGWCSELMADFTGFKFGQSKIHPVFKLFKQNIAHKISWTPDSTGFWSAGNIGRVSVHGLEAHLEMHGTFKKTVILGGFNYQWLLAQKFDDLENVVATRMIYQPVHSLNGNIALLVSENRISVESQWIGKRFTNVANTSWLPAYGVTNIRFQTKTFGNKNIGSQLSFQVMNLFDQHYQSVAWYPMPGRHFKVGVLVKLEDGLNQ